MISKFRSALISDTSDEQIVMRAGSFKYCGIQYQFNFTDISPQYDRMTKLTKAWVYVMICKFSITMISEILGGYLMSDQVMSLSQ